MDSFGSKESSYYSYGEVVDTGKIRGADSEKEVVGIGWDHQIGSNWLGFLTRYVPGLQVTCLREWVAVPTSRFVKERHLIMMSLPTPTWG